MYWLGLGLLTVLNIAGLAFVAFFKGYGAKKGENLATHEDIEKLVEEAKKLTAATEEIKAQTSTAAVFKQQQWTAKKDAIVEAVKELGTHQHSATTLLFARTAFTELKAKLAVSTAELEEHKAEIDDASRIVEKSLADLRRARFLLFVFCGEAVRKQFQTVTNLIGQSAKKDDNGEATRAVLSALDELALLIKDDLKS